MALTALSASLVAVYLVLPGAWQWARAEAKVEAKKLHQIVTVAPEVDPASWSTGCATPPPAHRPGR